MHIAIALKVRKVESHSFERRTLQSMPVCAFATSILPCAFSPAAGVQKVEVKYVQTFFAVS